MAFSGQAPQCVGATHLSRLGTVLQNVPFSAGGRSSSLPNDFPEQKVLNCHQRIQNTEKPWCKEVSGAANSPPPCRLTHDEIEKAFWMKTTSAETALLPTHPDHAQSCWICYNGSKVVESVTGGFSGLPARRLGLPGPHSVSRSHQHFTLC